MEVISALASWAGKAGLKSISHKISNWKKNKELNRIRNDYQTRSAFISFRQTSLSNLFQNDVLYEEFISHCYEGDLTKAEAINTFLYSIKHAPENKRCVKAEEFVGNFYDEVVAVIYRAIDKTDEPLAAAMRENVTETRGLQSDVQQVNAQLESMMNILASSLKEQFGFPSLTLLIEAVEKGSVRFPDFKSAVESESNSSISGKYLSAYLSLCKGEAPNFDILVFKGIGATLASSLASVAISSGQLETAVCILELCDEGIVCAQAVKEVIRNPNINEEMKRYEISEDSSFLPFAWVLNAELLFMNKAYSAACEQYELCKDRLNPVARCHSNIAKIYKVIQYSPTSISSSWVKGFAESFPFWGTEYLKQEYGEILEVVLSLIGEVSAKEIVLSLPEDLLKYLPNMRLQAEASSCNDSDELKHICEQSLEECLFPTFFTCAEKLIAIDSSNTSWVKQLVEKKASNILVSDFLFLLFYIEKLNPSITYSEYKCYENGYRNDLRFHLQAYKLFKISNSKEACAHIELALNQMAEAQILPPPDYSREWVGFLEENHRDSQVINLVKEFLPIISARTFKSIVAAIKQPIEKSSLAKELFEELEQSGNEDPELTRLIAKYYGFIIDDQLKAFKFAKLSFAKQPSPEAAISLAYASLNLSLDIPEEVEQYALSQKNTQLDIFIAENYRRVKMDSKADHLLKRAIFENRPDSYRAVIAYGSNHLGDPEREKPIKVSDNSCVYLKRVGSEQLIVAFHSESDLISAEGAIALGMRNYSTASPQYLAMRNHVVGDQIQLDSECWEIVDMDNIDDVISKRAIENIAKHPSTVVFSSSDGDVEDVIQQLSEYMENHKQNSDFYFSGIRIDEDTVVFLGIETGCMLYPMKPFEFIINVIKGEDMPFQRMDIGLSSSIVGEDFLLSYNAVILLAALDKLGVECDSIFSHCCITASTKKRLQLDIQDYSDSLYGSGKMVSIDGRVTIMEYGGAVQQELSEICSDTLQFLNKLKTVELCLIDEFPSNFPFLDQNTLGDMQTAKHNKMFYVTEDYYQALFSDMFENAPNRCSLYSLLIALGMRKEALSILPGAMRDWGANPPVDINITNTIIQNLESFLREGGGIIF